MGNPPGAVGKKILTIQIKDKDKPLYIAIAFLTAVFIVALFGALYHGTTASFSFATVAFIALVTLYLLEVLGVETKNTLLTLKKRQTVLESDNKQLHSLAVALSKAVHLSLDASQRWGGGGKPHIDLMAQYLDSVNISLDKNISNEVKKEIDEMIQKHKDNSEEY